MGFWALMLVAAMAIPLVMVIFGAVFTKKAPRKINYVFGYRTERSMKNADTWEFAHRCIGKIWLIVGLMMLLLAIIAMCLVIGGERDAVGTVASVVCMSELVPMMCTVIPVEIALGRTFDGDGKRK